MITIFEKFNNKVTLQNHPEIGDFVITKQVPDKIGKVILLIEDEFIPPPGAVRNPDIPLFQIEYPNDEVIKGVSVRGYENTFFWDEIVYWSKNIKDIKHFADGEKFGI